MDQTWSLVRAQTDKNCLRPPSAPRTQGPWTDHEPGPRNQGRSATPKGKLPEAVARRAAESHTAPDRSTASGTTSRAVASDEASEIAPMSGGDGTSPRMWMKKICAAIAVARMDGE